MLRGKLFVYQQFAWEGVNREWIWKIVVGRQFEMKCRTPCSSQARAAAAGRRAARETSIELLKKSPRRR